MGWSAGPRSGSLKVLMASASRCVLTGCEPVRLGLEFQPSRLLPLLVVGNDLQASLPLVNEEIDQRQALAARADERLAGAGATAPQRVVAHQREVGTPPRRKDEERRLTRAQGGHVGE